LGKNYSFELAAVQMVGEDSIAGRGVVQGFHTVGQAASTEADRGQPTRSENISRFLPLWQSASLCETASASSD